MKYGLSDKTIGTIKSVLEKYAVTKAVIYGSRALGTFKKGSDIDLTLHGDKLTFKILLEISETFDESDLPYTIDISLHKAIENESLKDHINRVGIVFFEGKK